MNAVFRFVFISALLANGVNVMAQGSDSSEVVRKSFKPVMKDIPGDEKFVFKPNEVPSRMPVLKRDDFCVPIPNMYAEKGSQVSGPGTAKPVTEKLQLRGGRTTVPDLQYFVRLHGKEYPLYSIDSIDINAISNIENFSINDAPKRYASLKKTGNVLRFSFKPETEAKVKEQLSRNNLIGKPLSE